MRTDARPGSCGASPHEQLPVGICIAWRCGNDRGAELERAARGFGRSRPRLASSILPHAAPYRVRHRLRQIGKNGAFAGRDQDVGNHARLELFPDFFGKLRHLH
jgi:hypothetical protein